MDDGSESPESSTYDGEQKEVVSAGGTISSCLAGVWVCAMTGSNRTTGDRTEEVLAEAGLDDEGHTPERVTLMADYSHSEYSRLRLQYAKDDSYEDSDDILTLQFIMSLGPHGAHQFLGVQR